MERTGHTGPAVCYRCEFPATMKGVPRPPKALIFDLGGVIVPFDFKRAYARIEPLCGYAAEEIPKRIGATGLVQRFESGQIEPEPFVAELLSRLGVSMSYAEFCDLWTCIFLPGPLIPEDLFRKLRERYRLILLSNTNAIHFGMLSGRYPLLDHFHDQVLSYQVGAMKPSPLIYQTAIARAGCAAEECFFTDDVLPYVEGARAAGMDAVQFQSAAQLERELQSRGVKWE
jgi:glucose-1-phosphatase